MRREPLHQGDLQPLPHGELDVLLGHRGEVAHERQRDLPQTVAARRERGDLEQPQPDRVLAVLVALQRAPGHQPASQPQCRAHRDAAAPAQLAQGQPAMAGVKGGQQRKRPVDDRFAFRRALAADALARLGRSRHLTRPPGTMASPVTSQIAFHSMESSPDRCELRHRSFSASRVKAPGMTTPRGPDDRLPFPAHRHQRPGHSRPHPDGVRQRGEQRRQRRRQRHAEPDAEHRLRFRPCPAGLRPAAVRGGTAAVLRIPVPVALRPDIHRRRRARAGHQLQLQREQDADDAQAEVRRHLHRRLEADRPARQGEPRPAQRRQAAVLRRLRQGRRRPDHERHGPGRQHRRADLRRAAGHLPDEPRGRARHDRRPARRQRPSQPADRARRLRPVQAVLGRQGQQLHGDPRAGRRRRDLPVRHDRLQAVPRQAGAGQRPDLRANRRLHARPVHGADGPVQRRVAGQERRHDPDAADLRQDRRHRQAVRQQAGAARAQLRHQPLGLRGRHRQGQRARRRARSRRPPPATTRRSTPPTRSATPRPSSCWRRPAIRTASRSPSRRPRPTRRSSSSSRSSSPRSASR